jgi:hypothetical protein
MFTTVSDFTAERFAPTSWESARKSVRKMHSTPGPGVAFYGAAGDLSN